MKILWVKDVEIENAEVTNVWDIIDCKAAKSILLNTNDWGYGQFEIDSISMDEFKSKISLIEDDIMSLNHNLSMSKK